MDWNKDNSVLLECPASRFTKLNFVSFHYRINGALEKNKVIKKGEEASAESR